MSEELNKEEFISKASTLVAAFRELYSKYLCGVDSRGVHLTAEYFNSIFAGQAYILSVHDATYMRKFIIIDGIEYFALFGSEEENYD
jgi:hypothetical protein